VHYLLAVLNYDEPDLVKIVATLTVRVRHEMVTELQGYPHGAVAGALPFSLALSLGQLAVDATPPSLGPIIS
jgi:hypothetical protein